jgi:hypothetical protein
MNMRNIIYALLIIGCLVACQQQTQQESAITPAPESFIRIDGQNLILPNGSKFLIKGTNLGNWLNPEGYMFNKTNSPGRINQMLCEMVGPDFVAEFWKQFKDNYITREDIEFIASTGANTIRLPFHYKLFTDEDYMGLTTAQDGFARIDSVVGWCRDNHLYLILDMHDAPGGQTGDNIDDSYGYPWLFDSEPSQQLFCDIWRKIADYYKNEPVILGYELINEPIAPYFENMEELNAKLEPLHKRAVAAIREVDRNHIILLGPVERQFPSLHRFDLRRQDHVHLPPLRGRSDSSRHPGNHRLPRPGEPADVYGRNRSQPGSLDERLLPCHGREQYRMDLLALQENRQFRICGHQGSGGLGKYSRFLRSSPKHLQRNPGCTTGTGKGQSDLA